MTKTYDVYGIGNALVDKEFSVDDEFFAETGIQKGFMTLIEQDEQEKLLEKLYDRYGLRKRAGGGSAANTLFALSQFGGKAFYSCKVANDETGDFYMKELGHHNIETNLANDRDPGVTGRCLVMVTPDAERTMLSNLAISQDLSTAELRHDAIADAEYTYVEGYLVTSPSALEAVKELKKETRANGGRIAFTFSDPAMVEYFCDGVNEVLGEDGVDMLFCNRQEAMIWSGEDDLDAACRKLEKVAGQFAVTLGADGALLYDGSQYSQVPAEPVKAVDTNGAGDMFAGAFMFGLTQGHSFTDAGRLATLASGVIVSSFGPRLDLEQHQEVLKMFQQKQSA